MTVESTNSEAVEPAESAAPAEAKNSVSPAPAPAASKTPTKPKVVKSEKKYVVSGNYTDEVLASRLIPDGSKKKSLSVVHLQRRLRDLGFTEGYYGDRDGQLGVPTLRSIAAWQTANKLPEGNLTHEQIEALFDGDPNVTVVLDTPVW